MSENKNSENEKLQESLNENAAEEGKKAIEAGNKINDNNKPADQKEHEEKEDAEKWRNEG